MTTEQGADRVTGTTVSPYSAPPASPAAASRVGAGLVVAGGVAALAAACIITPYGADHGPELCPFRVATGLPCPGCGLTRSWVNLMHGDVGRAFAFNLFGPITLAVTVIAVGLAGWTLVKGRGAVRRWATPALTRVVIALVAVWIIYGVARGVDAGFGWGLFPRVA
ncbi:DUF2752 domain-containing protein [Gordonia sp. NPDC003425]